MTPTAKKLIEVAMPIKEISAESVRDKSIRHGHISTLHLWWARRPLPVCRAVVFASLVPDPLDPNCPPAFREAIELLLGSPEKPLNEQDILSDAYRPYKDIPWTAVHDPMDDNPRNRLQMFIGKFTDEMQQAMLQSKPTPAAGKQLSDFSLIKWDNKNNERIINKARKLIFVAHNSTRSLSEAEGNEVEKNAGDLLAEFDTLYAAIKTAEKELYALPDRHLETEEVKQKTANLNNAIEVFLNKMPKVFDPFAGGGAIPLEAARLGCRSYGNDINPVAHIIQKGSLEFPQKYGKPITYSKTEFIKLYGEEEFDKVPNDQKIYINGDITSVKIANRLSFDVAFYAKKLLNETEKEIGYLYPVDEKGNKPIAYYWARVGTCSNPSCRAEVPLLKQFYLSQRRGTESNKWIYLKPIINNKHISFEITNGKYDEKKLLGWNERANLRCPCCGSFTDTKTLKKQFFEHKTTERLIAVIVDGHNGKEFRLPTLYEIELIKNIQYVERPSELMPQNDSQNLKIPFWGFKGFGDMFSERQLYTIQKFIQGIKNIEELQNNEYKKSIITYLGILIDRIIARCNTFSRWHIQQDTIEHPFSRQALPMMFDYPEMNPFCDFSGGFLGQLNSIIGVIDSQGNDMFCTNLNNNSSGEKEQFKSKEVTAVVTDPPYYDAIAYADLSDFFYVWLKRTLGDIYPLNFATPQTPKTEECTAIKHYFEGSLEKAKNHFENKLTQIFDAIEHQTSDIVSIMFAHQSTEAWTTLCNAILDARMNITGSWAIDTEMAVRMVSIGNAALASSVTVSCKPAQRKGFGAYREVKREIEKTVEREVDELYRLGFRGADLLTACFGQAVSEFGKYEKVEKADGSEITVAELLEMARESAFNALLKGFDGDDFTKFYIGWLQLYGFAESDFDDAAKFSRVGLSINVNELFTEHLLTKKGNKQTLGNFEERIKANKRLGENKNATLIDQVHRAMHLYQGANRSELLEHIANVADSTEKPFWRVLTSLLELLPAGCTDHKQASGLLSNRDSLIRESKQNTDSKVVQGNLFG